MSIRASRWVWDQKLTGLKSAPSARLVLLNLADRADNAMVCYPSVRRIADDTDLSERTVQTALRDLERLGFLHRDPRHEKGRQLTTIYRLSSPVAAADKHGEGATVAPPEGAAVAAPGVKSLRPRGAMDAPEPTIEPITRNRSKEAPRREQNLPPNDGDDGSVFDTKEIDAEPPVLADEQTSPGSVDLFASAVVLRLPDPIEEAVACWNNMAVRCGLSRVKSLTQGRRTALQLRLKDCGGLDGWRDAIAWIPDTPFLLGKNDRGWKADFDFVLKPKSFAKLREGVYANQAKPKLRPGDCSWMIDLEAVTHALGLKDPAPGYDFDLQADATES